MTQHLDALENESIYIIREAYSQVRNLGLLWSMGKDSTVLLHLVRKAFMGHFPIPLVHIDTSYKIPEMIRWRERRRAVFRIVQNAQFARLLAKVRLYLAGYIVLPAIGAAVQISRKNPD